MRTSSFLYGSAPPPTPRAFERQPEISQIPILPSGLNSSSKIFAISGAHIDSVTVIYLLPRKQGKCIDKYKRKEEGERNLGKLKIMSLKSQQYHKHSYPRGTHILKGMLI